MDDATSDGGGRMNSEAYRAALSAWIQPNASELTGQRFTVSHKHTVKATSDVSKAKRKIQYSDFNPTEHDTQLLKTKLKEESATNEQQLKGSCLQGPGKASHGIW